MQTPPELPGWLAAQLPFQRHLVEVDDGLRMHVMEQGGGKPVLLFHGNPTWGYLYRKVAAELEGESLRLIMPDLIGFGFSDRPRSTADHTLANHGRWMAELVRSMGVTDAVAVVQDWGGPVGLLSMARNPGVMSGLVVMNTTIGPPKPGFRPTRFHQFFSSDVGQTLSRLGFLQRGMRYYQGDRSSIDGLARRSYVYPLARPGRRGGPGALVRMVPDDMSHPSVPLLEEAGEYAMSFEGPIAIVWGDRDPVLGRLRRRVTRQLPQAEVTVTEAGHFLQEEVPAEIAAAIRRVHTVL